ncbi:MAG: 3-deoxy-manno-octulosonate cytidylyltransferase [Verrucomicrobia bacterium]|nr:3-deoxy-manno-octulosonate cytidylyltransferase [Verrucomicrobiota bacterium]
MSSCLAVIPARWSSSRFPGKPLELIAGKPLVQHVWERCRECSRLDDIVIATDDVRIRDAALAFGADARMTRPDHPSGTDRIAEVAALYPSHDRIINVQGDEPLVSPALIDRLALTLHEQPDLPMVTAANPIEDEFLLDDPNVVKTVLTLAGDALYFSRSRIPFPRTRDVPGLRTLRHKGIYGYRRDFLLRFVAWPPGILEQTESLEQLRALENGARIRVLLTDDDAPGVDTPEQARIVAQLINAA